MTRGRAAVARQAHNLEVAGSNPVPAIKSGSLEARAPGLGPGRRRFKSDSLYAPVVRVCETLCGTVES